MTSSEINKIKKDVLKASDQSKARVCRAIRIKIENFGFLHVTEEHKAGFVGYCESADFEGAVTYLFGTILPYMKKHQLFNYDLLAITAKVELNLRRDFKTQYGDQISEILDKGFAGRFLKLLNTNLRKKLFSVWGDLLYLLQEMSKRESTANDVILKHCVFHLLAQILTNREWGKLFAPDIEDGFLYLQEKYHCFNEEDPKEMALFHKTIRQNDFKDDWTNYYNAVNKSQTPNITLPLIRQMMSDMDQRHAEEVHYLFVCRYIDYSHYKFRDPWMIDLYLGTYWDFYRTGNYLYELNHYVWNILDEWKKDANHKYQRAKRDLYYWISDPIPEFAPSLGNEIKAAYDESIKAEDSSKLANSLMPFPKKIAEIIKSGNYEDAAANIYCLLEHLATANKTHEDWFESLWFEGEMSKIALLTETICELYCHLRQQKDLSKDLKDEMDIHLDILNKKTEFFGEMWYDSRFEDMLLDSKDQTGDYSTLEDCCMWREWYCGALRHLPAPL